MKNKNLIKNVVVKSIGVVNALALVLVAHTANVACGWLFYQDEEPEEVKKLRRF